MPNIAADWPSEPYKGLVYYGAEDRLLFSGRDHDVETCIHFLAASETRILLLHGQTGCGKSSLLRAGLIPGLEENAFGYLFLRDAAGSPLFIRSGADPLARIAEHVFQFASQPVSMPGVTGETVYDLSAARLGHTDLQAFVQECRKPGAMMRSLRALSSVIPYTLVIILDQAEEVIAFSDANYDHRRQFFRFIREFGTSNFPVKLILALRKDYSGEFIGLAQLGGSIDLRENAPDTSPPSPDAPPVDRFVKSDIKIFLLAELTRAEVLHAIELPTSKEKVYEGRSAPFDKYRFSYAPRVAQRIVDDLFAATSATAVLPVMQIVCRDLYNEARRNKKEPPWQIDDALYAKGGGISGPVDRHIAKSLRDGFGALPPGTDVNAEEQRWRELLFRLVRREADGTVHTNIVEQAQLRAMANECGIKADLDKVTGYLTRSDVLLLRSVSVLAGSAGHESKLFSLGHDVIGMVLQEWKSRAVASQRLTAEEKASKQRITRWMFAASGVVVLVAGVAAALVFAFVGGRLDQKHDVLLRIAAANGRSAPMDAMYAAAHATRAADDMHMLQLWKARDRQADQLLANIIAGMPVKTTFESAGAQDAGAPASASIPLPKSIGFANIDKGRAEIAADLGAGGVRRMKFDLDTPVDDASSVWSAGEPRAGTVVLLRSSSPSAADRGGADAARVYVLTKDKDGQTVRPFNLDYFRNKTTTQAFGTAPGSGKPVRNGAAAAEQAPTQLDLKGSAVVLSRIKPGEDSSTARMDIAVFVFDPTRPGADPFRLGLERQFYLDQRALDPTGFNDALWLDSYVVIPTRLDSQSGTDGMWARYDLKTGARKSMKGADVLANCKTPCDWELIPRDTLDNLMVFGKVRPSVPRSSDRSYEQAAIPDTDRFDRFIVFDAANDHALAIDANDIRAERTKCAGSLKQSDATKARSKGSTTPMFVAGAKGLLVFGLQSDHSVDLIQIRDSGDHAVATCVGILLYPTDATGWRAADDGRTLLAVSSGLGLSWNMSERTEAKANALMQQGGLVDAACEEGLKGHESENDELTATTTTYLGVQRVQLCNGPSVRPAKMLRPSARFPGLDVTTQGDLSDAFRKKEGEK